MKYTCLLFIIIIILFNNQCKQKECVGEPIVLEANENIKIKILNAENESIFIDDNYLLDSLIIYENTSIIEHEIEESSLSEEIILSFPISITHFDTLNSNLNKELNTTILLKLKQAEIDTLLINLLPIKESSCKTIYDKIDIIYNSNLIENKTKKNCISCREPIIIKKP